MIKYPTNVSVEWENRMPNLELMDTCEAIKDLVVALKEFTHLDVVSALAASGLLTTEEADLVLNTINGVVMPPKP